MGSYCPNCSAELQDQLIQCWNCGAAFGSGSSWQPTATPNGQFQPRDRVAAVPESPIIAAPIENAAAGEPSFRFRKATYFLALVAVGYSSFLLAGLPFVSSEYNVFTHFLGLPVPRIYGWDLKLSNGVKQVLSAALLVLVLRRVVVMFVTGFSLPWTIRGPLYYLMAIPIWSLFLSTIAFALSMVLNVGSGVPAALIGMPAFYFLATGIAIMELLALWPRNARPNK